jgi:hypothetical protein
MIHHEYITSAIIFTFCDHRSKFFFRERPRLKKFTTAPTQTAKMTSDHSRDPWSYTL